MDNGSLAPVGYTPDQVRTAYGFNSVMFGSVAGDGAGQTIAIVDCYDDPSFVNTSSNGYKTSDLAQFDAAFDLPDPPSFTKVNETGGTSLPGTDPAGRGNLAGNWEIEEALDIEWAHAMAPGANIVLVEATSDTTNNDLLTAVKTAATLPGVSAISMSWGLETEIAGELATDSTFVTPAGHQGVTFLAASGDSGSPGYYPAYSPNVVAVGGTSLNLNTDNSIQSEIAWAGSGGGTSKFESEPAYQLAVQNTGFRTIPDVAFDADPYTGVAVYDSYNDTDGSGPWVQIGGTSLASPSWAGLIAVVNQGRVLAGAGTLDGPTETLPYLYAMPAADFNDIVSGSNTGYNASPGYDEVTGLGSPKANLLINDLANYGTASKFVITANPPSSVIAGDPFAVAVAAENTNGGLDPEFNGSVTISLSSDPTGAALGGTLKVNAVRGEAVFNNLTISLLGSGYQFTAVTKNFPSLVTSKFSIIQNPTPWQGTYYPGPTDANLRAAINAADSNGFSNNVIELVNANYLYSDSASGEIVVQNLSSLPAKTLSIVGAGAGSTVIEPSGNGWQDRLFEIVGTTKAQTIVNIEDLTITGGNARGGGVLGGVAALGGGILIDNALVTLQHVSMLSNVAFGLAGAPGATGAGGNPGGAGAAGKKAEGGAIYLAGGALTLVDDTFANNKAVGGIGGAGGNGRSGISPSHPSKARSGGPAGRGGTGGNASGGAIYVAGGDLYAQQVAFSSNAAVGGAGGVGGKGGNAGIDHPGGLGGDGGAGGLATAGAIYVAGGSLTFDLSQFSKNQAAGGAGGAGGQGGLGGSAFASSISVVSISGGNGLSHSSPPTTRIVPGPGATGGVGGAGSLGGNGAGGAIYISKGSLTLIDTTLDSDKALGGKGGAGGSGGHGAIGSFGGLTNPFSSSFGLFKGVTGGAAGAGGNAGDGVGGGLYLAGGSVTVLGSTLSRNQAVGGVGGAGGTGGSGGFLTGGGLSGFSGGGGTSSLLPPALTGGAGGAGGAGGVGQAGGFYVSGGALTFLNSTVAANSAAFGGAGAGGAGGAALNSKGDGAAGDSGSSGSSSAGAGYIGGGTVYFDNTTLALNLLMGPGLVAGVVRSSGTVSAASSIFASNGNTDFSGSINATNSLFSVAPAAGMLTGSNNKTNLSAELDPKGLQNNGGPTETIALVTKTPPSPALSSGSNPESLLTDQRGWAPRTGPSGTDAGSIQHDASADSVAPTAILSAQNVTTGSLNTVNAYTFTITYQDNVGLALATVAGAQVFVSPPAGGPEILASLVSATASGPADALGDAKTLTAIYQIPPPGGLWTVADDGHYTISLGGAQITDFAGNPVPTGVLGGFNVSLETSDTLVVSTEPPSEVAAGVGFGFVVEVKNSSGSLDTSFSGDVTVGLATNSTKGVLAGMAFAVVTGGVANFSGVALQTAGSGFILSLSATGLAAVSTSAIKVDPAAADHLLFSTEPPASAIAGSAFPVQVTAYDHYGNVDTNFTSPISLALSTNPQSAKLFGSTTVLAKAGVAVYSNVYGETAGNGYVITASASGVSSGGANPLSITAAAAHKWVVTTEPPSSIAAGSTFGLVVSAEDKFGNAETSYSSTVVLSLSVNPGNATLLGTVSEKISNGVATFSGLSLDIAAIGYTISASDSFLLKAAANPINVTALSATHLAIATEPPSSVAAGSAFPVVVQAEDKYNNIDTSYTGKISLALSTNPGAATLLGTTALTANAGVASFQVLRIDPAAIGYVLTATSSVSGVSSATSNPLSVTAAAAHKWVVTTEPPSSIAAASTFGLVVSAEDQYGNAVSPYSSTVALSLSANPGHDTLLGTVSETITNGVATFTGLSLEIAASGYTISAGDSHLVKAVTSAINVTALSASKLAVTTQPPASDTAGSAFSIEVQAEDKYSNLVASYTGSISLALSTNPTSTKLYGTTTLTAKSGVADFSNVYLEAAGAGYVITASASGVSSNSANPLSITAAAAHKWVVTTEPPSTIAAGSTFGLVVNAEDKFGNAETSYSATVLLSLSTNPGQATLLGNVSEKISNGVATFSGLSLDVASNGYKISASDSLLLNAVSNSINVTALSATHLALETEPPSTIAAGAAYTVVVVAEDKYNNIDTSYAGNISLALSTNPKSAKLNGTTTLAAKAGVASFSSLSIDLAANGYVITASGLAAGGSTFVPVNSSPFDVTADAATRLVVIDQPPSQLLVGQVFSIVVAAEDKYGNIDPNYAQNVSLAFSTDPTGAVLSGGLTVAASGGEATFTGLSINQAGNGFVIQVSASPLSVKTISFDVG